MQRHVAETPGPRNVHQAQDDWASVLTREDLILECCEAYEWTKVNFIGWAGNGPMAGAGAVYDDVYVATGANSQARVEIGDAPRYQDCKNLTVVAPYSWSSTRIVATVHTDVTKMMNKGYLFVVDADLLPGRLRLAASRLRGLPSG